MPPYPHYVIFRFCSFILIVRTAVLFVLWRTMQVLAGYLMFGTVAGIMMALFLDNVGGAWDNAKKYVEVMMQRDCCSFVTEQKACIFIHLFFFFCGTGIRWDQCGGFLVYIVIACRQIPLQHGQMN